VRGACRALEHLSILAAPLRGPADGNVRRARSRAADRSGRPDRRHDRSTTSPARSARHTRG